MKISKRPDPREEGFVVITVLGICFLAVTLVAAITSMTISDMVASAKTRAVIEARNSAESTLDTFYAVINRSNHDDIIEYAHQNFVDSENDSPVSDGLDSTSTSGSSYGDATVTTQLYLWSAQWFAVDDDGNLLKCGIYTSDGNDDGFPCFRMRINKVITNPMGNSGLVNVSNGTTQDYQSANNIRTEYVVDLVVRHKCVDVSDVNSPTGCTFSRFEQKIRKREFIQHIVMSDSEQIAPQVYNVIADPLLRERVASLDNAYAANDRVTGNIHTNDAHVYVCDGFGVQQPGGSRNWITSGYSSSSSAGSPTQAAASPSSNFSACNGSSGQSVTRYTASRSQFPLPQRLGDSNGSRLLSISMTENADRYVLTGTQIRINFRYDITSPDPSARDRSGMMNVVIDGIDRGWYSLPANGVISVNPDLGQGTVTVSGVVKGRVTLFSTGSITVANSLTYYDASLSSDLIGLYASRDIILSCYNDGHPTHTGQCDNKEVDGLLWAAQRTVAQSSTNPNEYHVTSGGTIYNDHWNDSSVANLDNPPRLTIKGAMVSYYRGTFGSIESTGSGRVTGGWQKDFIWDSRLSYSQPPYMLRDALATFVRSTTQDQPCDEVCG